MPHLNLEYSSNLQAFDVKNTLLALNKVLIEGGHVKHPDDVKSRATCQNDFVIGLDNTNAAYLYLKVALMAGRSPELKTQIATALFECLKQQLLEQSGLELQVCVDVVDIDSQCYQKVKICT